MGQSPQRPERIVTELAIRRAEPREAALLTELAHAAKRHWGYPEEWIARWRDALTVTADYIDRHEVYVVERAPRLLGFYGLRAETGQWSLDHFWIHPTCIGRGIGTRLFHHAAQRVAQLRPGRLVIESDPFAVRFYLEMGAKPIGEIDATVGDVPRILPVLAYEC